MFRPTMPIYKAKNNCHNAQRQGTSRHITMLKTLFLTAQKSKKTLRGPNRSRTGDFGKAIFGRTAVLHSTTELPALGCFDEREYKLSISIVKIKDNVKGAA
jgi:hypothetical protein